MSNVQLSVCLVTYNHVRYIEEAIQSVLAQKLAVDWELIISDDCSTDGTQDIVRRYAAQQPQIVRPILRERNLGAFVHVTELLRAARGEFVAYLDGDDKYTDASKLQIQMEYLRDHPGCAGCFHDLAVVSANGDTVHESLLAAQGSTFRPIVQQADLFNAGEITQINT